MAEFTLDEVAKHSSPTDMWIVVDGDVYDVTKFSALHPGGHFPLAEVAGTDCTEQFYGLHRGDILKNPRFAKLKIGTVAGKKPEQTVQEAPYAEAHGFWRKSSPYYTESHHRFRAAIREIMEREVIPTAAEDDEEDSYPSPELMLALGKAGFIAAMFSSDGKVVKQAGFDKLPGGVDPMEVDEFHELILTEEVKRIGCYGFSDGLNGGLAIGLPPVYKFGSQKLIDEIVPAVFRGEKRICLAITEPYGGSDVAGIHTTAVKSADGKTWTINGVKKWITGGMFAEYFTTLCKTDKGITMIVVPRSAGVDTKRIKTSYSGAAGTAYVEYKDCVVPVEYTVGKEGSGFMYAMANFNKERWGMVAAGNRMSRLMVEECFKWALQRKVFGKRLIDQPVIRFKLAQMAAEVEAVHSLLEDLTYQMTQMSAKEVNSHLAGPIALLKYQQTRVATLVSDNACQIFGGRALTRTGMGQFVEKFQRSFKMQAILGGSEEIMADFAMRQAVKKADGKQVAKL
mmetsp:Transcript_19679/g.47733  ORF Transcript_19679/g.47733 Transcript_19679/m.47733 type:complete len:511 (-) Transcript_19679:149-1681(-)